MRAGPAHCFVRTVLYYGADILQKLGGGGVTALYYVSHMPQTGVRDSLKCQMTHANHHRCTAGCEVKVAWEELYMDCPEMFDSTRQIENWLSCRAGEGKNHKTDVLPKTYVLFHSAYLFSWPTHPPIGAGLVSIYSRHHTAVQPICTAWEELYMDCPEMFDSTRQIENWLSCRVGEGRNHKTQHVSAPT